MSTSLKQIPLTQLQRSKINIRKTDRHADIEQMAASIEANGLLENLVVQKKSGDGDARYEVVAGGRRLAALKLLAKRKKIDPDRPIPCLVLEDDPQAALEASLAENTVRMPVHPADQFEAFAALVGKGTELAEVASRFGVTDSFVQQRLKLAALSPRLIAEYRSGAMTLEQLTAFTLSDDQALQEATWFDRPYADMPAAAIRRFLTRSQIDGTDRRARFIGPQAYEEAGGTIVRDLFQAEGEGYYSDSQLLDRLVAQKLETEAAAVRADGWAWVEVHPDVTQVPFGRFGRAATIEVRLSDDDEARLTALGERYDELVSALEGEDDPKAVAELDAVTAELEALQAQKSGWSDEQRAKAGAIVAIDTDGSLFVMRGLLNRPAGGEESARAPKKQRDPAGYSEPVLLDLSAHRTAVLREELANKPGAAQLALLHALVERSFFAGVGESCLSILPTEADLARASPSVSSSKAAQAFQARHADWQARLPEPADLWVWLSAIPQSERETLLAHCTALTVNALEGRRSEGSLCQLAKELELNMTAWWRPTRENFLDRLSKTQILAAVAEGVSPEAASRLRDLKKESMASEAERLLGPTAWLPSSLRLEQAHLAEQA